MYVQSAEAMILKLSVMYKEREQAFGNSVFVACLDFAALGKPKQPIIGSAKNVEINLRYDTFG